MTITTSKICIVGDFAVGKTSVIERFVNNQFSDKYLTTVGVKIDTKEITLKDLNVSIKLIIWDVAGAEVFGSKEFAYCRGAAGFVFVVDGTRQKTLDSVRRLREQISQRQDSTPNVLLLNKKDLAGMWQVGRESIELVESEFDSVFHTSAKTGDDVDTALIQLASLIVSQDIRPEE